MTSALVVLRVVVDGATREQVTAALAADKAWQREVQMAIEDACDRLDITDADGHIVRVSQPRVTFDRGDQ